MPSSSLMNFHYDETWDAGTPTVFLTAQRVWGPLIAGGLFPLTFVILMLIAMVPL